MRVNCAKHKRHVAPNSFMNLAETVRCTVSILRIALFESLSLQQKQISGSPKSVSFLGEEEQRNERGVTFYKRIKESRHKRYEACDDDGADVGIRTPETSLKTYTISNRAPSASSDTSANIALIL